MHEQVSESRIVPGFSQTVIAHSHSRFLIADGRHVEPMGIETHLPPHNLFDACRASDSVLRANFGIKTLLALSGSTKPYRAILVTVGNSLLTLNGISFEFECFSKYRRVLSEVKSSIASGS